MRASAQISKSFLESLYLRTENKLAALQDLRDRSQ